MRKSIYTIDHSVCSRVYLRVCVRASASRCLYFLPPSVSSILFFAWAKPPRRQQYGMQKSKRWETVFDFSSIFSRWSFFLNDAAEAVLLTLPKNNRMKQRSRHTDIQKERTKESILLVWLQNRISTKLNSLQGDFLSNMYRKFTVRKIFILKNWSIKLFVQRNFSKNMEKLKTKANRRS